MRLIKTTSASAVRSFDLFDFDLFDQFFQKQLVDQFDLDQNQLDQLSSTSTDVLQKNFLKLALTDYGSNTLKA